MLHGPGSPRIPTALTQGRWPAATLPERQEVGPAAAPRGRQRRPGPGRWTPCRAASAAQRNPPIGGYHRQFGYTPAAVAAHGTAFAAGMADAGVAASVKHFPGLGRVSANTDTTAGVTDRTTVRRRVPRPVRRRGQRRLAVRDDVDGVLQPDRRGSPGGVLTDRDQALLRGDLGSRGL